MYITLQKAVRVSSAVWEKPKAKDPLIYRGGKGGCGGGAVAEKEKAEVGDT